MAQHLREALSGARSRFFFPLFARFDAVERRLDATDRAVAAAHDTLRSVQATLVELDVELARQQARVAALEEATAGRLESGPHRAQRLNEIGGLLGQQRPR